MIAYHNPPILDFIQYRYFEKGSIYRCDRHTHEAEVYKNGWEQVNFNLTHFHPHAIDMMDFLERSCRNIGFEIDKDGYEWDTFSEIVLKDGEKCPYVLLGENNEGAMAIRKSHYPFATNYSYIVLAAAHLAQEVHFGQTDKAGKDYFSAHLLPVGALGQTWKEQIVGLLHDAAEDTPYNVDEIIGMLKNRIDFILSLPRDSWISHMETALHLNTGASCDRPSEEDWNEVREALLILNHHLYPSRETYIMHIKSSPLATRVKLNDLTSNMDISRIDNPTNEDKERTEKYKREFDMLTKCN